MEKEYITLYQRPAAALSDKRDPEYKFILKIARLSNTLIFPEYFTFHPGIKNIDDLFSNSADTLKKLFRLSQEDEFENTMIVGGTIFFSKGDLIYNAAPVIYNGTILNYYFKRNLFLNEANYLSRGDHKLVLEHPQTRDKWGFLICADVNNPDFFAEYKHVRYIAIPVASPYLPNDTDEARLKRDLSIFQNGARDSQAVLFKCCLTGHTGTIDEKLHPVNAGWVQGRSLIATPEEIAVRAPHIHWQGALCYSERDKTVKIFDYEY